MDAHLLRKLENLMDGDESVADGATAPGRSTLTSRITPAPQVIFRVSDPETARALGESLSGGSRGRIQRDAEGGYGARDGNGVAEGAEAAVDRAAGSGGGSPLRDDVRGRFETSLGADLSAVRVHTGGASAEANQAVGARAYTVGNDIHFGEGNYRPDDPFGMHLLAHEVAHTVQQSGGAARRQHKLEVSTPNDALEHEADRAADSMVKGEPVAVSGGGGGVLRRDPNNDPFGLFSGQPQPDPFGFGQPTSQPSPFGPGVPGQASPFGPFAPNADKNGVAYDVPSKDYRASAGTETPALDSAMPNAEVADPGTIPGWSTIRPATVVGQPPFQLTQPASLYIVHGDLHSHTVKEAWESYKNELIPNVKSAWDGDAKAKMDSYTQEAKGNPDLDKLVAETKKSFNVAIKQDGGTISEQGGKQQVTPGNTTQQVADKVAAGGDELKKGAAASAEQPEDTTVSGPVKAAVDNLNAHREKRCGKMKQLGGLQDELDGCNTELAAGEAEAAEWSAKQAEEEEKKKDPHWETAKKIAGELHPKLKEVVATIEKYKEPLMKLKEVGENGMKAYSEKDAKAGLDAAMGLAEVAKWAILQGKVAELAPAAANPRLLKISAAHKKTAGVVGQCAGLAKQIEGDLKQEKLLYEMVAAQMEKHWKGKDPAQGKAAADALRAIPHVDRLVRMLKEMKGAMPKLPSVGTRASQGFALATDGFQAPGAADLLKVAGWVKGAPEAIGPEVTKWEGVRAQLESVAGAVGIV